MATAAKAILRSCSTKTTLRTEHILEDGDMFIEVKGAKDHRLRYLVGSQVLASASKVFRAMFGPKAAFYERIRLDTVRKTPDPKDTSVFDGKPIFKLEDNPEILAIIFKIIHHVADDVPRKLTFDQMVTLAIITDKYELRAALQLWADEWASGFDREPFKFSEVGEDRGPNVLTTAGMEDWLFVAWVFNYKEDFRRLSSNLIGKAALVEDELVFSSVYGPDNRLTDHLPESVIDKLKKERLERVTKIKDSITKLYNQYCRGPINQPGTKCACKCKRHYDHEQCQVMQAGNMAITMATFTEGYWDKSLEDLHMRLMYVEDVFYPGQAVRLVNENIRLDDTMAKVTAGVKRVAVDPAGCRGLPNGNDAPAAHPIPTSPFDTYSSMATTYGFFGPPPAAAPPVPILFGPTGLLATTSAVTGATPAHPQASTLFGNTAAAAQAHSTGIFGSTGTRPTTTASASGLFNPRPAQRPAVCGAYSQSGTVETKLFGRTPKPAAIIAKGKICTVCKKTEEHAMTCTSISHYECSWLFDIRAVVQDCYYGLRGIDMDSFASKQKGKMPVGGGK